MAAKSNGQNEKNCHIVVGGGASGIFLCKKLLERDDVILIERGLLVKRSDHPLCDDLSFAAITEPNLWFNSRLTKYSCLHKTSPQEGILNRQLTYQQGAGLGGSTNINAMILTAGHATVFDKNWPSSWNSNRFKKIFSNVIGSINPQQSCSSVLELFNDGNPSYPSIQRYDDLFDRQHVRSSYNLCCHNNFRFLIQELLEPTHQDHSFPNSGCLKIMYSTVAEYVIFDDNKKAIGVTIGTSNEYGQYTQSILSCKGNGEVILCCGVFESPRLLLASLVRQDRFNVNTTCSEFTSSQLKVLNEYPSLGRGLQDHVLFPIMFIGNWSKLLLSYHNKSPNGVHGWLYFNEDGSSYNEISTNNTPPCVQMVLVDGTILPHMLPEMLLPTFDIDSCNLFLRVYMTIRPLAYQLLTAVSKTSFVRYLCSFLFGFLICNVQPRSRGYVEYSPTNSSRNLQEFKFRINLKTLDDERDRLALINVSKRASHVLQRISSGIKNFWHFQINPFWLSEYLSLTAQTYFHACGTCQMSEDRSTGVVNDRLQVHGLKNIRIADASVIPSIPSGPIAATCMALGHAAGEIILE